MKILFIFLLLFINHLFANFTSKLMIEGQMGFRQDYLEWESKFDNLVYKEKIKDAYFYDVGVSIKTVCRDVFFIAEGKKGYLIKKNNVDTQNFSFINNDIKISAKEDDSHLLGIIGVFLDLTPKRTPYSFLLTPLVGYVADWKNIKRYNNEGYFINNDYFLPKFDDQSVKELWQGPGIGMGFILDQTIVSYELFYLFSFLKLNHEDNSILISWPNDEYIYHEDNKLIGAYGHMLKLKLDAKILNNLTMNLLGNYQYYDTNRGEIKRQVNNITQDAVFNCHWNYLSILLGLSVIW